MLSFMSQGMAVKKLFKVTGSFTNLPGRGLMFILPPHTVRRMISKAKNSPSITVGKLKR